MSCYVSCVCGVGLLGVNLDPKGSAYYLVPSNMFIEFISLAHCDQEQVRCRSRAAFHSRNVACSQE